MKINEKYLIDKIIETLKDDPEYNTGSLVWWYSDSLDIMQPCRMGTLPDLGVDDWELVVVSQDLEYYLPNDSPNCGVKRRSGPHPWGSSEEGDYLMNDIENTEKMVKLDSSKKDSKTNKGVKRRSGPHPWESTKEGSHLNLSKEEGETGDIGMDTNKKASKTNKFEILYKAGVIGWLTISLLLSVSAVGNIYGLQKQVRDMDNDISKLEKSNAELKKNFSTLVKWNNQLDANDTKNALYTQQRFAAVYEKIGLQ